MDIESTKKQDLIIRSRQPYNAEPRADRLTTAFVTDVTDFYVRSHGEVPALDAATHRLRVDGLVKDPLDLSMDDLQRFPQRKVTAVMQCAGNRRADLHRVRPVSGHPWEVGAIGNAAWTGVALSEVLRAAGARTGGDLLHVAFSACDMVDSPSEGRFRFGASIPMTKAMSPEVLLAFAMNGAPLTAEHGFPLRVVVPGYAGVRSPKWLVAITVQDRPSDNHMQQRDYKMLPAEMTEESVDWEAALPIYDMPANAAICDPTPDSELPVGAVTVKGYAVASGRDVVRVDVSADAGRTWRQAALHHDPGAPWSWTFWRIELGLGAGDHELVVRAWDSAGQSQPEDAAALWNFKGYLSAAWHRVRVRAS